MRGKRNGQRGQVSAIKSRRGPHPPGLLPGGELCSFGETRSCGRRDLSQQWGYNSKIM